MEDNTREPDPLETRHRWRDYGNGEVACRECGASPWTRDGRRKCPVNSSGAIFDPIPLSVSDLAPQTCTNPQCVMLAGIAKASIETMEQIVASGLAPTWADYCDELIAATGRHWEADGVQR